MPAVYALKPEEIDTNEITRKITVSVIGCEKKVFFSLLVSLKQVSKSSVQTQTKLC
jgi:hypothetical protein